jgi:hypothetical protein
MREGILLRVKTWFDPEEASHNATIAIVTQLGTGSSFLQNSGNDWPVCPTKEESSTSMPFTLLGDSSYVVLDK